MKKIDEFDLNDQQRTLFKSLFTGDGFKFLHDFGRLCYQFYVAIKIFEKNNARQYLAVPVIEQIEENLEKQLDDESLYAYHSTVAEFKKQINIRKKKTMHWELLLSEFSLTPSGRLWLRKKIERNNPRAL